MNNEKFLWTLRVFFALFASQYAILYRLVADQNPIAKQEAKSWQLFIIHCSLFIQSPILTQGHQRCERF